MSLNIGSLFADYRRKYNYSQIDICNGICSISNFSDYENEVKIPDILTLTYFFERIGYVPRGLIVYMPLDGIKYWNWYRECNKVIQEGEYHKLNELYSKKTNHSSLNQRLVRQFDFYLNGIMAEKNDVNLAAAEDYYYQALRCTCDDIETFSQRLISYSELKIFWNYLNVCQIQGKNIHSQIEEIMNYIYDSNWSDEQRVKILPNFIVLWCKYSEPSYALDNKFMHLKDCINLLIKTNSLNCIILIYTYMVDIGKKLMFGMDNYESDLNLLVELFQEFEVNMDLDYSIFNQDFMYEVVGDYLKNARKKKCLSQEYLSDGICAVESYNRIENGRQPTKKKYESICQKLDIEKRYYFDQISTDTIEALMLKDKINTAINLKEYKNALYMVEELSIILDSQNIANKQYIQFQKTKIYYLLKMINTNEYYNQLKEILGYTLDYDNIFVVPHTYTLLETKIINHIIVQEYKLGYIESAINVSKHIIRCLSSLEYDLERFYDLKKTKINLGKMLSDQNDTSQSLKLFYENIKENLERKNSFQLEESLAEASFILLQQNPQSSSKLCQYALLICKIFNKPAHYSKLQTYYNQYFGES